MGNEKNAPSGIYLVSKMVSKEWFGIDRTQSISELYDDMFPKAVCGKSITKKKQKHLLPIFQKRMTKIMRKRNYVNIIASGWMRAFFADYSFHPLNYILVKTKSGEKVVVGIDFGSARFRDRHTKNVTWDQHFDPLSLHRSAMGGPCNKKTGAGWESNYFKFLPKEHLFGEESVNMLKVLSGYDVDKLKTLFQDVAEKYEKVHGFEVMYEFGKRFGCIRSKDDSHHSRSNFVVPKEDVEGFQGLCKSLTEEETKQLGEPLAPFENILRERIMNDYFWVLSERQKRCKLMLAEVMLYRFACGMANSSNPLEYFNADSDVIQHLKRILTRTGEQLPILVKAITRKKGKKKGDQQKKWKEIIADFYLSTNPDLRSWATKNVADGCGISPSSRPLALVQPTLLPAHS